VGAQPGVLDPRQLAEHRHVPVDTDAGGLLHTGATCTARIAIADRRQGHENSMPV
jgi:hypothetical protein